MDEAGGLPRRAKLVLDDTAVQLWGRTAAIVYWLACNQQAINQAGRGRLGFSFAGDNVQPEPVYIPEPLKVQQ